MNPRPERARVLEALRARYNPAYVLLLCDTGAVDAITTAYVNDNTNLRGLFIDYEPLTLAQIGTMILKTNAKDPDRVASRALHRAGITPYYGYVRTSDSKRARAFYRRTDVAHLQREQTRGDRP